LRFMSMSHILMSGALRRAGIMALKKWAPLGSCFSKPALAEFASGGTSRWMQSGSTCAHVDES